LLRSTQFNILISYLQQGPRKYGISTIVALQDMAQLEDSYTSIKAKVIRNTFGNYFLGRSSLEGGKYISELMGKKEIEVTSTTKTEDKVSTTIHTKEVPLITPQEAMSLDTGEFAGKVVHPSGGFFRMQLEPVTAYYKRLGYKYMQPLPIIHKEVDIDANFKKIKREVEEITSLYKK